MSKLFLLLTPYHDGALKHFHFAFLLAVQVSTPMFNSRVDLTYRARVNRRPGLLFFEGTFWGVFYWNFRGGSTFTTTYCNRWGSTIGEGLLLERGLLLTRARYVHKFIEVGISNFV